MRIEPLSSQSRDDLQLLSRKEAAEMERLPRLTNEHCSQLTSTIVEGK